jgi:hypothetical protein
VSWAVGVDLLLPWFPETIDELTHMMLYVSIHQVVAVFGTAATPAFHHWEKTLPSVAIPLTLRTSVSPLDGTQTATRFATAVTRGAIFPATTASFCKAAGLLCDQDIDIAIYTSNNPIHTINDFQFDFFLEPSLQIGATMKLDENLHDPIPLRSFLPKSVADTLPSLTTPNLPKLMQTFNIQAGSRMANIMAVAVRLCEEPALPGERRACPTSVEAMAEFVSSEVGSDVELLATSGAPEVITPLMKPLKPVRILQFTKRSIVEGKHIVICHNLMFPSQMYYCHHVTGTKVVQASLEAQDEDGSSVIQGVAVCHLDTTMWASEHPAFASLNIPRGAEACHWIAQNDLIWMPKSS